MKNKLDGYFDVKGFEGLYAVNILGDVYSYPKKAKCSVGYQIRRERILKPTKKTHGYLFYRLYKDGKPFAKMQHRLIAETFILNPENKPFINHKNHITSDNRVENLEWATHIENSRYTKIGNYKNKSSKYKGVSKAPNNKWKAYIRHFGKLINLGTFENEEDAATAYNLKAFLLFGNFALYN